MSFFTIVLGNRTNYKSSRLINFTVRGHKNGGITTLSYIKDFCHKFE